MSDRPERRLAAILSADAVGYSRLMSDDEAATVATVERFREALGGIVDGQGGRVVDAPGDNLLAEFPTATEAVRAAVAMQRRLASLNEALSESRKMRFRIGVHLGEVRIEGSRLYGDGVNIAARLEGLAEPGGILASGAVFEQTQRSSGVAFRDRGERQVKNIPRPVRVYDVSWAAPEDRERPPGAEEEPPAVAVLPFVNMSSDPDQDFFADGMAEEIINALSHVKGLRVIARTSAFSFRGADADIQTIGSKLRATAVVEGSVRKMGDRLRITAQLIDVAGGHHLWSERYDRTLDDVFEIQDEIAATVVRTIKPKLLRSPEPLVKRATENHEAYELYLRASERLARYERWDTRTAIEMLRDAVEIDPGYVDAWARLGHACCQMRFHFEPKERWHRQAGEAIDRACALDPDNAQASYARGRLLWSPEVGFHHEEALRLVAHALEHQPGLHDARIWQSIIFIHLGLYREAEDGLTEVLEADHRTAFIVNQLASLHGFLGDFDEAAKYFEEARKLDPTFVYNHFFSPTFRIYAGDLSGAEAELEHTRRRLKGDSIIDANQALLLALRGDASGAEEAIRRASEANASLGHLHHTWHLCAAAWAQLGRTDEALELARRTAADGFPSYPLFRDDPLLAPLREEPEMQRFLVDLERGFESFRTEFGAG